MARWAEMRLVVPRGLVEQVGATVMGLGAAGVQEDYLPGEAPPPRQPWDTGAPPPEPKRRLVKAWWPDALVDGARTSVARAVAGWAGVANAEWSVVEDEDWAEAWKAGFERLVVSDRLAVAPPWAAEPGDLVIEPGMAFGTGEHPTTRACLAAIDRLARPGDTCFDVGCGTGVLGIAAARLGMVAGGVDIDPDSVEAARQNAVLNGVTVDFSATAVEDVEGVFDLVVANLFAEVLVALARPLQRMTGQRLVLAGILVDKAHLVEAAMAPLALVARVEDGDWVCLEYARP
jgi:ribosomal protein L11 methyltransferase